jgi:hypothetical protein
MTELCSICRENMDDNKQHYMLRCNHRFHTECIIDSLRTNNECPVCRDTGGYKHFSCSVNLDNYHENNQEFIVKKKICKSKIDDINNIIKLMNDLSESNLDIKKIRNEIKAQVKIFKKNTNNLYRNIKSFENKLDKKHKDEIKEYLVYITSTDDFQKGIVSKNAYKEKIIELHKVINKQILDMGIPSTALDSLKYNTSIKTQYEKYNDIYIDEYYNDIYNIISKSIKKVNNNSTIII